MSQTKKIAVIGFGHRGLGLLEDAILPSCEDYKVEVAAVFDLFPDRTQKAAKVVLDKTGKEALAAESYQQILDDPQIDAVIITAAWEAHTDMAVAAMRAGKHAAIEVGGAYCIEDCWKLVETYEQTGKHCMMLENCCYGEKELFVLNMVRQGMFGEIVHCEGGYHHSLGGEITGGKETKHYRLRNYLNRNCENYPTHELGPIAKILGINNGNRMLSLTSTASCAKGLNHYAKKHRGADDPLASAAFAQGDIVTTVIKCAKGQTITLTLDTTLPRSYSRGFTIRGTKGAYFEDTNMVFLEDVHDAHHDDGTPLVGNGKEYAKSCAHPLWKDYDPKGGHGGMDYLVVSAFFEALVAGKRPPIDTYDTAAWMAITPLSEQSIIIGSAPVMIPDFTRGKWYQRKDIDDTLIHNLDVKDVFAELY